MRVCVNRGRGHLPRLGTRPASHSQTCGGWPSSSSTSPFRTCSSTPSCPSPPLYHRASRQHHNPYECRWGGTWCHWCETRDADLRQVGVRREKMWNRTSSGSASSSINQSKVKKKKKKKWFRPTFVFPSGAERVFAAFSWSAEVHRKAHFEIVLSYHSLGVVGLRAEETRNPTSLLVRRWGMYCTTYCSTWLRLGLAPTLYLVGICQMWCVYNVEISCSCTCRRCADRVSSVRAVSVASPSPSRESKALTRERTRPCRPCSAQQQGSHQD